MSKRDYYEILGVDRGVSKDDLKKSFRRKAMKFHPDRLEGKGDQEKKVAKEKFQEIQEAYAVLSDEQKRQSYDQFGHAGVDSQAGGGGGGGGFGDMGDVFGDIFGDIFGGGGGRRGGRAQSQRGADLAYEMVLDLEEAVAGISKEIKVATSAGCKTCDGSGAKKGSRATTCSTCGGSGQMRVQHGFIAVQQTCRACHGEGKVIKDPCASCHGQGVTQQRKTLSVKVPAGVDSGDRIRLSGEGDAGRHGAPSGDLYVQIKVRPHRIFKREDTNLYCEVPIGFVTAAAGGDIEVPTLKGKVKLNIPEGTQTNKLFRLRGKGIKALRGSGVGDLLCRVVLETPVKLSDEQKDQLRQFDVMLETDNKNHRPKASTWFDTVKDFFK